VTRRLPYKGALICPCPLRVRSGNQEHWNGDFTIEDREGSQVHVLRHGTGKIYGEKEEALKDILTIAKRIIDGH